MTKTRINAGRLFMGLVGLALLAGCATEQASDDVTDRFVGTWQLESWEHEFADGTSQQDPRTQAYIMYSDAGYMCFVANDPNRPVWESSASPTASEALSGISGLGAYCATVEINVEESFVLHHRQVGRVPNTSRVTVKRVFEFRGVDELILTPDPSELTLPQIGMRLVWRRVDS